MCFVNFHPQQSNPIFTLFLNPAFIRVLGSKPLGEGETLQYTGTGESCPPSEV